MAKKDGSYLEDRESQNWNVAKPYTDFKIMKWLVYADEYDLIATFGTSEMLDEFNIDEKMRDVLKMKALKRLHKTMDLVVNNTIFAVRPKDKKLMQRFAKLIEILEPLLDEMQINEYDEIDNVHTISIDEKIFNFILKTLIVIKRDINYPLNRAELIFASYEEHDLEQLKREFLTKLKTKG